MNSLNIPISGPEFEELMREVDAKLVAEGVDIPGRPLMAVREVSMRFGVPIPIGGANANMPPDLKPYAPLSQAINEWFKGAYGERLNTDPCPGRTAVLVDSDLYVLRIPRIFGCVQFVASREFKQPPGVGHLPAICNVLQLVESLSQRKASHLSDGDVSAIWEAFQRALPSLYMLENTPHSLIAIARGDVATAVSKLLDPIDRFGESKWASLQATEKAMKSAIALAGGKPKPTHNLSLLSDQLLAVGIALNANEAIAAVQCAPAIRYGDETCSQAEALAAHHASLDIINSLKAAGAKFRTGLG